MAGGGAGGGAGDDISTQAAAIRQLATVMKELSNIFKGVASASATAAGATEDSTAAVNRNTEARRRNVEQLEAERKAQQMYGKALEDLTEDERENLETQLAAEKARKRRIKQLQEEAGQVTNLSGLFKVMKDRMELLAESGDKTAQTMMKFGKAYKIVSGGMQTSINIFKTVKGVFSNVAGVVMNLGRGLIDVFTQIASSVVEIGLVIAQIPFKFFDHLFNRAKSMMGGGTEIAQAWENVRKTFGDVRTGLGKDVGAMGQELFKNTIVPGLRGAQVFGSLADAINYAREVAEAAPQAFQQVSDQFTGRNATEILALGKGLGVATEDLVGFMRSSIATGKGMEEQLVEVTKYAKGMGAAFGLNSKMISRDMAKAAKDIKHFANSTVKQIAEATTYAHKLGLSLEEITGVLDAFNTFESAADNVAKLSQAFGVNIDAMDLLEASSPAEALEKVKDAFAATGKSADQMNRQELQLIASSVGMSEEAVRQAFSMKNAGVSMNQVKAASGGLEKQSYSTSQALGAVSKDIEKVVQSGQVPEGSGFLEVFLEGIMQGIDRTPVMISLYREMGKAIYSVMQQGRELGRIFVDNFPGFKPFIEGLTAKIKEIPALFKDIKEIFTGWFAELERGTATFGDLFERVKAAVLKFFGGDNSKLMGGLMKMWEAAKRILTSATDWLFEQVKAGLKQIREFIMSFDLDGTLSTVASAGGGIWDSLVRGFDSIKDDLVAILEKVWDLSVQLFVKIFTSDAVKKMVNSTVETLKTMLLGLTAWLKGSSGPAQSVLGPVMQMLSDAFEKLKDPLLDALEAAVEFLFKKIGEMWDELGPKTKALIYAWLLGPTLVNILAGQFAKAWMQKGVTDAIGKAMGGAVPGAGGAGIPGVAGAGAGAGASGGAGGAISGALGTVGTGIALVGSFYMGYEAGAAIAEAITRSRDKSMQTVADAATAAGQALDSLKDSAEGADKAYMKGTLTKDRAQQILKKKKELEAKIAELEAQKDKAKQKVADAERAGNTALAGSFFGGPLLPAASIIQGVTETSDYFPGAKNDWTIKANAAEADLAKMKSEMEAMDKDVRAAGLKVEDARRGGQSKAFNAIEDEIVLNKNKKLSMLLQATQTINTLPAEDLEHAKKTIKEMRETLTDVDWSDPAAVREKFKWAATAPQAAYTTPDGVTVGAIEGGGYTQWRAGTMTEQNLISLGAATPEELTGKLTEELQKVFPTYSKAVIDQMVKDLRSGQKLGDASSTAEAAEQAAAEQKEKTEREEKEKTQLLEKLGVGPSMTLESAEKALERLDKLSKKVLGKDFNMEKTMEDIRAKFSKTDFTVLTPEQTAGLGKAMVSLENMAGFATTADKVAQGVKAGAQSLNELGDPSKTSSTAGKFLEGLKNLKNFMSAEGDGSIKSLASAMSTAVSTDDLKGANDQLEAFSGFAASANEAVGSISAAQALIARLSTPTNLTKLADAAKKVPSTEGLPTGAENEEKIKKIFGSVSGLVKGLADADVKGLLESDGLNKFSGPNFVKFYKGADDAIRFFDKVTLLNNSVAKAASSAAAAAPTGKGFIADAITSATTAIQSALGIISVPQPINVAATTKTMGKPQIVPEIKVNKDMKIMMTVNISMSASDLDAQLFKSPIGVIRGAINDASEKPGTKFAADGSRIDPA